MNFADLRGKNVIVTGAGSGIGRSLAKGFVLQGATVLAVDISEQKALETQSMIESAVGNTDGKCLPLKCDVTKEDSVMHMVDEAVKRAGRIDVLVNNAGIVCEKIPVIEISETDWDAVLNVNLKGVFLCSKHVGKIFAANRSGSIINVGSITAKVPRWRMAPYSASKAAVLQLTKVMALEMAEYGVRVNAICPGGTNTPLMQTSTRRDGESSFEYRIYGSPKIFRAGIPLRRLAEPDDHVGAALFLASSAAQHITGQALYIDGGESVI
jgi:NAD(P)-dependent dehydrogenase (short-subunit alcohol dehydrogenase family)